MAGAVGYRVRVTLMVRRTVTLTGTLTVLVVRRTLTFLIAILVLRMLVAAGAGSIHPCLTPEGTGRYISFRVWVTLRESPLRRGSHCENNPAKFVWRGC